MSSASGTTVPSETDARGAKAPERAVSRWIRREPSAQRLSAALQNANAELQRKELSGRKAEAANILDAAYAAARAGRTYEAWERLHAFERELIGALSPEELELRLLVCQEELDAKVHNWRKKAGLLVIENGNAKPKADAAVRSRGADTTLEAMSEGSEPSDDRKERLAAQVRELMKLLHESMENRYYKIDLIRGRVVTLAITMILCLGALFLAAKGHWFAVTVERMGAGALLGAFGAVLSMAFGLLNSQEESKIPEVRSYHVVSLMRPLLGAGSAVVVVLFETIGVFGDGGSNKNMILLFCFLAGFSERWFLDKIEKIDGAAGG